MEPTTQVNTVGKDVLELKGDEWSYVHDEIINRISELYVDCPECESIIYSDEQYQCGTCNGGSKIKVLDWVKKQLFKKTQPSTDIVDGDLLDLFAMFFTKQRIEGHPLLEKLFELDDEWKKVYDENRKYDFSLAQLKANKHILNLLLNKAAPQTKGKTFTIEELKEALRIGVNIGMQNAIPDELYGIKFDIPNQIKECNEYINSLSKEE